MRSSTKCLPDPEPRKLSRMFQQEEKLIAEEDLWGAVVRWPVAEGE